MKLSDQEKFEIFVQILKDACKAVGWSIGVPGADDEQVNVLILGNPQALEEFVHENLTEDTEVEILHFEPDFEVH